MKEKSVGVEDEPLGGVGIDPSVATNIQTAQPSSAVTSFFKSQLWAIKEKQGVQDQK